MEAGHHPVVEDADAVPDVDHLAGQLRSVDQRPVAAVHALGAAGDAAGHGCTVDGLAPDTTASRPDGAVSSSCPGGVRLGDTSPGGSPAPLVDGPPSTVDAGRLAVGRIARPKAIGAADSA